MINSLSILNRSLAVGGKWSLPSDKNEAAKEIKVNSDKYVADFRHGAERIIGIFGIPSLYKGKAYAAALAIGLVEPDAIVIQEIEEDQVWVAALREGVPLASYDVICSAGDARQILTDMLSYNPSAVVIGNTSDASKSLEEVLGKLTKKNWENVRLLLPKRDRLIRWVSAVLGIACFTAAGVALYLHEQEQRMYAEIAEHERQAFLQRMLETQEEEARRNEWSKSVRDAIQEQTTKFTQGVPPREFARSIRGILGDVPLSKGGWNLDTLTCSVTEQRCTAQWSDWDGMATPLSAMSLPGFNGDTVEALNKMLVTRLPHITFDQVPIGKGSADDVVRFATETYSFKFMQTSINQSSSEVFVQLPTPPPNVSPVAPQVLGRIMKWTMTGSLHQVMPVLEGLNYPGVRVVSATISGLVSTGMPTIVLDGHVLIE